MANINIILADAFELTKAQLSAPDLIKKISDLYGECIRQINAAAAAKKPPGTPHTFTVTVVTAKPAPTKSDVLIYLIPPAAKSIISLDFGALAGSHTGRTLVNKGASTAKSEVYVPNFDTGDIGATCMHELLHYKTLRGDAALHSDAKGKDVGGLANPAIDKNSTISAHDVDLVSGSINTQIEPWTDGWDTCLYRIQQIKTHDPALELGL